MLTSNFVKSINGCASLTASFTFCISSELKCSRLATGVFLTVLNSTTVSVATELTTLFLWLSIWVLITSPTWNLSSFANANSKSSPFPVSLYFVSLALNPVAVFVNTTSRLLWFTYILSPTSTLLLVMIGTLFSPSCGLLLIVIWFTSNNGTFTSFVEVSS